jgi:phage terminase large subunit-like protein
MAGNTAVHTDGNENIKPMKNKSGGKIDGIQCLVMDIGMEMGENEDVESVYEKRGLLEFEY